MNSTTANSDNQSLSQTNNNSNSNNVNNKISLILKYPTLLYCLNKLTTVINLQCLSST